MHILHCRSNPKGLSKGLQKGFSYRTELVLTHLLAFLLNTMKAAAMQFPGTCLMAVMESVSQELHRSPAPVPSSGGQA